MTLTLRLWLFPMLAGLLTTSSLFAQAPPSTPPTAVMAFVNIKAEVDRAQLVKLLPDEVRATLRLYLEGKILHWYSRGEGRGPVFILNCGTVAEAKALMDGLPLTKAGFTNDEFTVLSPLAPLGLLLNQPSPMPKGDPQP